jgi:hypothetical protein
MILEIATMLSFSPKRFALFSFPFAALALLTPSLFFSQPARASHPAVRRLHFAPGRRQIVVIGSFSPGHRPPDYTLFAHAGQRLRIRLQDLVLPGHSANNRLATMYHITFPSGKQYGMKGYDPFPGILTQTGVYRITVEVNQMASNSNVGRFRLTLTR